MADDGADQTTNLEMPQAGLITVRCMACGATVGQTAPVPGLYNVYHCRKCGRWIDFCIPPLSVLRRVVAIADGGEAA